MKTVILPIKNIEFTEADNELLQYVSKERQALINRFRVSHAKKLSLYAALLARMEISSHIDITHNKIDIMTSEYGKPYIKDNSTTFFNLSHTRDVILFSITDNYEVGVDIEGISSISKSLCEKVLHKDELAFFYSLPIEKQQSFFFEIWTKKEAYSKYLGSGLRFELNTINTLEKKYDDLIFCSKYDKYIFSICCEKLTHTFTEMSEAEIIKFYKSN